METTSAKELFAALRVQRRVMGALFLRDIFSRHGNDTVGHVWMFFEPIAITLLVFLYHGGGDIKHGEPMIAFLITGFMPHLLFRHCGLAGISAVNSGAGLLYHRQIHYLDLVAVKLCIEVMFVLVAFNVVLFSLCLLGILEFPRLLTYLYLGWFFQIWFAVAAGFIFTGWGLRMVVVRRIFQPIAYLMIPVYGTFFSLDWVSPQLRRILLWFPPANATEMIRFGYFGPITPTYFDAPYTAFACLVLTFIGVLLMQNARAKLEY
jgi:capsular polysaccharide transport system permease protein